MLNWTKPDRPFDRRNKCGGGVVAPGEGRSILGPPVGPFLPAISRPERGRFGRLQIGFAELRRCSPPTLLSPFSDLVDLVSPSPCRVKQGPPCGQLSAVTRCLVRRINSAEASNRLLRIPSKYPAATRDWGQVGLTYRQPPAQLKGNQD